MTGRFSASGLLATGVLLAAGVLAGSAVPGSGAQAATRPVCTENADYLVVELPHRDSVGNSYIVRDKTAGQSPVCSTRAAKGDFVVGRQKGDDADPFFLLRLEGPYLLIDSGTGPDRDLVIYDLKARKAVYSGGYSDEDIRFGAGQAVFWAMSSETATKKTCPKIASITKNGLTPTIETETTFDYATGAVTPGTAKRCVATQ